MNALDGTAELDSELALFNKVGDLHLKTGDVASAVDMYERAANRYAESGLPNNAIALCNKILRNAPGRTQVYLKLAKLMVDRGFTAEAKQHLLEYANRMQKASKLDEAFTALKEFADLSPDNEEIRLLLAEQLKAAARTDEAREQLAKLHAELEARGDIRRSRATIEKMKNIDPDYDATTAPRPAITSKKKKRTSDLIFLDLDEPSAPVEDPVATEIDSPEPEPPAVAEDAAILDDSSAARLSGLDVGAVFEAPTDDAVDSLDVTGADETIDTADEAEIEGLVVHEPDADLGLGPDLGADAPILEDTALEDDEEIVMIDPAAETPAEPVMDLGAGDVQNLSEEGLGVDVPDLDLGGFATDALGGTAIEDEPEVAEVEDLALATEDDPIAEPPMEAIEVEAGPPDVHTLEEQIADDPDDPQLHRALAETLVESGERERGIEELDITLGLFEAQEEWAKAEGVAEEILRVDPNSVRHHQKRVEYVFRRGDKGRLVDSYLELADALFRSGTIDRARAVYQRVLEHDPDNERAGSALGTIEPIHEEVAVDETPAEPHPVEAVEDLEPGEFVDLGSLIFEEEKPAAMDTRMRIEEEEPTGDEQRDFDEMLSRFKKGIDANVADEDWQAHYDLGVAYKEMGLVDEAISAFQKALRSSEGRMKSAEALGLCFFEKGQFSVAGTVLRRAVEAGAGGDDQKIGLLYWLGRCEEEQGHGSGALVYYQRVFAIDIHFQDVRSRVSSLAGAGS